MLAVNPGFIEQAETETIGLELSALVIHHYPVNDDFTLTYQLSAKTARAKTLRLQDAIKASFCHPKTGLIL
jgi:hypothetical protein